jgi:hypothetical protein
MLAGTRVPTAILADRFKAATHFRSWPMITARRRKRLRRLSGASSIA